METQNNTIKEKIEFAQQKYLQEKIFRSRWKSIRASGIGDICDRRIYYYITCGELADEINTDLAAIFEEGKDQEPTVRRLLSELGFEVKKASFTANWDKYNISGGIDGIISDNGTSYIAEIKTVSEYAWRSVITPEDFNEGYYNKKWYAQMQIYLLLFNHEKGIFILKRKQAKQLRIIEVQLDYAYAEGLLQKAERVNKAIEVGIEPGYLPNNPVECKRCAFFGKVCNPPLDFGDMAVIEDPELERKLERRAEIENVHKEYEVLDKELKERFREIPAAICGNYSITGKAGIMKQAAREANEIPTWKIKIEKIDEVEKIE